MKKPARLSWLFFGLNDRLIWPTSSPDEAFTPTPGKRRGETPANQSPAQV